MKVMRYKPQPPKVPAWGPGGLDEIVKTILSTANSNNIKMTREEQLYLAAIINANRHQKLHELGHLIKGTPAGTAPAPAPRTKGASGINKNLNSDLNLNL
jgi:hypothetical protein